LRIADGGFAIVDSRDGFAIRNLKSATRNLKSAIALPERTSQSAIRNPQSASEIV
jgi:hypothetical protein